MSNLKTVQEKSKQSATAARESAKRQAHPWRMKGAVFVGSLVFLASLSSWWKQYREESASRETPPAQEARAQAERNAPEPPVAQEVRLNLSTTEWSEPVYNRKGKCLQWHRTNPDLPPALAEVKDGGDWHTPHPREPFAWIRFKAPVEGQNVVYEIKPDGTCS